MIFWPENLDMSGKSITFAAKLTNFHSELVLKPGFRARLNGLIKKGRLSAAGRRGAWESTPAFLFVYTMFALLYSIFQVSRSHSSISPGCHPGPYFLLRYFS